MEDPQGTLSAESGPWNGVLNQLKELTKEMKNFGPFSPPRKCWTCHGNHLQRDCLEYAKERRDEGYYLDPRKARETPPWKEVEIIVFLASSAMGCEMNDE